MECSSFKSGLLAFREGTLSEELRHSYENHLVSCNPCVRLLSEFNRLDAVIEMEKAAEPNPFAATRILQRLENDLEHNTVHPARWIRVLQPAAIAFALLCGILIGSYTARQGQVPEDQLVNSTNNIEFLRSNLFISEFADEDKILVINN